MDKKLIISGIGGAMIVLCVCGILVYFHYDHIQKNRLHRVTCFRSALMLLTLESHIQGDDSWIAPLSHTGRQQEMVSWSCFWMVPYGLSTEMFLLTH